MVETEKKGRTVPQVRVSCSGVTYQASRAKWLRWNRAYYKAAMVNAGGNAQEVPYPKLSEHGFRVLAPEAEIDVTEWDAGKATEVVMGDE